jgi:signal transduction histidine kinase
MGQLSAGIAHEINNPLGIILLHAEILKDELRERSQDDLSEWREDLDLIAEQAERCKSIVAGLLNFARKNEVAIQETSVYQVLDKTLRAVAFRNGVTLKVNRPDHDVPIALDVDQMVQALTNLLRNADEAMPSEGVITLSVQCGAPLTTAPRSMPEWVEFQVHDNGTGIPKAVLPKIFEPLFTTKGIGKGTGLGLAVTYGIVKMHRGTIDVQSNALAEKGPTFTRFSIRIPMKSMERSLT